MRKCPFPAGSRHRAALHRTALQVQDLGLALPLSPPRCYRLASAALLKIEHCANIEGDFTGAEEKAKDNTCMIRKYFDHCITNCWDSLLLLSQKPAN